MLDPDAGGCITLDSIKAAVRDDTILISIMHLNNELGTLNDIEAIGSFARSKKSFFMPDYANYRKSRHRFI